MAADEVGIKISVETQKALADVSSFSKKASDSLSSLEDAAGGFGSVLKAAVAIFAGREILRGLEEMTSAASEGENALNQMQVSLKLAGDFSKEAASHLQEFAEKLQATTTLSSEAALKGIALAKSFNATNDEAEKMVQAAADLSAATGISLNTAIEGLGKTLEGTAGKFGKMVPGVNNLTQAQLRSGDAIQIVGERFKGASEALGNTFSGSITKAHNAFGEILKTMGGFITQSPVILKIISMISDGFREFNSFLLANTKSIREFVTSAVIELAGSISFAVEVLRRLTQGIGIVLNFVGLLAIGITQLIQIIGNIPGASDVFAALGTIIGKVVIQILEFVKVLANLPGVKDSLNIIGVDVDSMSEGIRKANQGLVTFTDNLSGDKIKDGIKVLADGTISGFDKLRDMEGHLDNGFKIVEDGATRAAKAIAKVGQNASAATKSASDAIANATKVISNLNKEAVSALIKNPFAVLQGTATIGKNENSGQAVTAAGLGIGSIATKGAAGASSLVSAIGSGFAESFLPGLGEAVGPILQAMAQGPEAVKGMIDSFIDALPEVLANIVKSIPVILDTLAQKLPDLIDRIATALSDAMPDVAANLAAHAPVMVFRMTNEFIKNIPHIVSEFSKEMLKIPGKFLDELVKGLKDALRGIGNSLNPLSGSGGGGLLDGAIGGVLAGPIGAVAGVFGGGGFFAEGGLVPSGFPRDSFPARMTSGELVISPGPTAQLQRFLDQHESGPSTSDLSQKIDSLTGAIQSGAQPQNLQVNLKVGERDLAKVMLNLNRQGFRTT